MAAHEVDHTHSLACASATGVCLDGVFVLRAGIQRLMTNGSGKLVLGSELRRLQKLQRVGTHLRHDVGDAVKALEQVSGRSTV